jgi:hypothetical protein
VHKRPGLGVWSGIWGKAGQVLELLRIHRIR